MCISQISVPHEPPHAPIDPFDRPTVTMASASFGSRFRAFMNHPAGPKTGKYYSGWCAIACHSAWTVANLFTSILLGPHDEMGPCPGRHW